MVTLELATHSTSPPPASVLGKSPCGGRWWAWRWAEQRWARTCRMSSRSRSCCSVGRIKERGFHGASRTRSSCPPHSRSSAHHVCARFARSRRASTLTAFSPGGTASTHDLGTCRASARPVSAAPLDSTPAARRCRGLRACTCSPLTAVLRSNRRCAAPPVRPPAQPPSAAQVPPPSPPPPALFRRLRALLAAAAAAVGRSRGSMEL